MHSCRRNSIFCVVPPYVLSNVARRGSAAVQRVFQLTAVDESFEIIKDPESLRVA